MSDRPFLTAIRDYPEDDGPRLVYADWLDERGDPRGEFIRLGCKTGAKRLSAREGRILETHLLHWLRPLFGDAQELPQYARLDRRGRFVRVAVPYMPGARSKRYRRHWAMLEFRRGFVAVARFYWLRSFLELVPSLIPLGPAARYEPTNGRPELFSPHIHGGTGRFDCSVAMKFGVPTSMRVTEAKTLYPFLAGYDHEDGLGKHYLWNKITGPTGHPSLNQLHYFKAVTGDAMTAYARAKGREATA